MRSPDGTLFRVVYSKHILYPYTYNGDGDGRQHLEVNAHVGGVNHSSIVRVRIRIRIRFDMENIRNGKIKYG